MGSRRATAGGGRVALVCAMVLGVFGQNPFIQNSQADEVAIGDVRIGVMGLFHPVEFVVTARPGSALVLQAGDERMVLEQSSGVDSAEIALAEGEVVVTVGAQSVRGPRVTVSGRNGEPTDFVLAIQRKIIRRYRGRLEIFPSAGVLSAVVTMDRETVVASVLQAESAPDTPFEALKAQAVAARSYLVAGRGRHHDFDFCDTTHCQFLREPPALGSAAARAAAMTRGLILEYESHPIAAMYTRSCSGRTQTSAGLGLKGTGYPYYSVECKYCREHPVRWSSRVRKEDAAALRGSDEAARLSIVRRLGWSVVPGNDYVAKVEGNEIALEGTGEGHGMGLCQAGAKAMAQGGADFREILSHYYPNTKVVSWGVR